MQRMNNYKENLEAEIVYGAFDSFPFCMICWFRNERIRKADFFNILPKSWFHLGSCIVPMYWLLVSMVIV